MDTQCEPLDTHLRASTFLLHKKELGQITSKILSSSETLRVFHHQKKKKGKYSPVQESCRVTAATVLKSEDLFSNPCHLLIVGPLARQRSYLSLSLLNP